MYIRDTTIGVGAHSTWGEDIFARKLCMKNLKMPEFYVILSGKLSKCSNLYNICPNNHQNSRTLHHICPKMPEICTIIAPKIFFSEF